MDGDRLISMTTAPLCCFHPCMRPRRDCMRAWAALFDGYDLSRPSIVTTPALKKRPALQFEAGRRAVRHERGGAYRGGVRLPGQNLGIREADWRLQREKPVPGPFRFTNYEGRSAAVAVAREGQVDQSHALHPQRFVLEAGRPSGSIPTRRFFAFTCLRRWSAKKSRTKSADGDLGDRAGHHVPFRYDMKADRILFARSTQTRLRSAAGFAPTRMDYTGGSHGMARLSPANADCRSSSRARREWSLVLRTDDQGRAAGARNAAHRWQPADSAAEQVRVSGPDARLEIDQLARRRARCCPGSNRSSWWSRR